MTKKTEKKVQTVQTVKVKVQPIQVKTQPIRVTEMAIKKIGKFAKEEKKDGWGLKIRAQNNDGFEPAYEMDFLKEPDKNDTVLEFSQTDLTRSQTRSQTRSEANSAQQSEAPYEKELVRIFLDAESLGNLEGAEVDFLETEYGSGFKINNPQFPEEIGGCGPGGCEGCGGGCG